jgi:hypothetical protein
MYLAKCCQTFEFENNSARSKNKETHNTKQINECTCINLNKQKTHIHLEIYNYEHMNSMV